VGLLDADEHADTERDTLLESESETVSVDEVDDSGDPLAAKVREAITDNVMVFDTVDDADNALDKV